MFTVESRMSTTMGKTYVSKTSVYRRVITQKTDGGKIWGVESDGQTELNRGHEDLTACLILLRVYYRLGSQVRVGL
jgi:hypothetical protein